MAYSTILESFRTCNAEVRNESLSAHLSGNPGGLNGWTQHWAEVPLQGPK
jgi:hypothetical protein